MQVSKLIIAVYFHVSFFNKIPQEHPMFLRETTVWICFIFFTQRFRGTSWCPEHYTFYISS